MKKESSLPPQHADNTTIYCYYKMFNENTKLKISFYEVKGIKYIKQSIKQVFGMIDIIMDRIDGT
jgi:hypothetical protein